MSLAEEKGVKERDEKGNPTLLANMKTLQRGIRMYPPKEGEGTETERKTFWKLWKQKEKAWSALGYKHVEKIVSAIAAIRRE